MHSFSEGLSNVVTRQNKADWGFMDAEGNIVIEAEYAYAYEFSEDLAAVKIGDVNTGQWDISIKKGKLSLSLSLPMRYPSKKVLRQL